MSAEAMDIVQAFRRAHHAGENDRFTRDTGLLQAQACRAPGRAWRRPAAGTPAAGARAGRPVVDRCPRLRDAFGIGFDGIDDDAVAPNSGFDVASVSDICIVDPARRAALVEAVDVTSVPEPRER